jgi:hypothetical protein
MKHKVEIVQLQKVLENGSEQHLYVIVSQDVELIKEGDYYYWPVTGSIIKHKEIVKGETPSKDGRKVIATTDTKLTTIKTDVYDCGVFPEDGELHVLTVPQVQQSFIKEFVVNPDKEWEVEYEKGNYDDWFNNGGSPPPIKLKLNPDNTVNITAVEKKMYSELDLKIILCTYSGDSAAKVFKWVKKNL